jgi:hypothetical protein
VTTYARLGKDQAGARFDLVAQRLPWLWARAASSAEAAGRVLEAGSRQVRGDAGDVAEAVRRAACAP